MRSTNVFRSSILLALMGLIHSSLAAENLPAHGSTILRGSSDKAPSAYPEAGGWMNAAFGAAFVYYPSVDNDQVQDPLGLEIHMLSLKPSGSGYKVSLGVEKWDSDDPVKLDDATLVPVGISVLLSPIPPRGSTMVWIEAGLRYVFIDAGGVGGSYDDAVTAVVGGNLAYEVTPGMGVGVSVGYQADVLASENDKGDEYTLNGLMTQISLRFEL